MTEAMVSTKFLLTPEQMAALKAVKDRDGVSVNEQVRRGVDLWLAERTSVDFVTRAANPKGDR